MNEASTNREFIQRVFDTNPNILYIFDLDEQRVIFENEHVSTVIGYTAAEVKELGASVLQMTHPDDMLQIQEQIILLQSAADDDILELEYRVRHRDGSWRWLLSRHTIFERGEDGRVSRVIGAATDITERKEAEAALSQSQAHYRLLFESVPDGILIADTQSYYLDANPQMCTMLGYTHEELVGLHGSDIVAPQEVQQIDPALNQIKTSSEYFRVWQFKRKDGSLFSAEVRVSSLPDGNLLAVVRDITERVEAEERRKYQALLLESISDAVITTDLDFVIQSWNSAAEALYGWRAEEVLGKTMVEMIPTSYLDVQLEEVLARFATEGRWQGEVVQQHKDGQDIYIFASVNLVVDEYGEPVSVMAINRDITLRKQAEMALQESEEKLQLFIEHAPASLAMFDREMHYIAYSHRWLADYGLEKQTLAGRSHYDVFPEIPDRWRAIHQRALKGEVIQADEDPFVRAIGNTQWLRWEVRPWYTAEQTIGGIVVFSEDITEFKETREALRQSELLFKAIVEDQTELIVRYKTNGSILFANEAYARIFNTVPGALIGQSVWSILEESLAKALKKTVSRLTPSNPVIIDEYSEVLPDGRPVWMRWTERGIFDEDGRLAEIQAVGYDITERRHAEEQLRFALAQLQQLIQAVPEGVLLLSDEGSIHLTNPVAAQYLSILAPDLEDGRLQQLGERPLNDLLTSPPEGLWHEILFDDYVFEVIARPVEVGLENNGWVLVLRDVTQERTIQQHLQQQERLAAVGQLASGIAHDFNNILAVIVLYSQLILRSTGLAQSTKEKMVIIERQAKRATDLIQQILDFSRQSVMERKPLDLVPFMKNFVNLLERTMPESIEIELNYGNDLFIILADPSRIQQVMMNLCVNARDAMPGGGRLAISLAQISTGANNPPPLPEMPSGNWIQIQVEDSGSGIPQRALSKIFEPFFTTKEVGKGTGLGLAQVYGIMEQHEGYIDVSSHEGQGTTFFLYFQSLNHAVTGRLVDRTDSLLQGQGQTILLVEDGQATRQALLHSLISLNYQVIEASNGREALELLATKAQGIDLIVSDVVMPEMGGIALLQAIRRQRIYIPLVLLTGHPLGDELEKLQAMGLAGWLPKPPALENLSQLLARILGK